jgi:hypothetical protein
MRLCRYAGLDAHPQFKLERSALHTSPSFVGTARAKATAGPVAAAPSTASAPASGS